MGCARRRYPPSVIASPASLQLRLDHLQPFPWEALLAFLARRAIPGVEEVEAGTWRRIVSLDGRSGWVEVRPDGQGAALVATVDPSLADRLVPLAARLRRLFDLDADPLAIDAHLATDEALRPSVERLPGLRVPGAVDGFEAAVRAILGQQVTVKGATVLAGRLAERFGTEPGTPFAGLRRIFPTPAIVAAAGAGEVARLGMPGARAHAIVELASAVDGGLRLEPGVPIDSTLEQLRALPGFGEWTTHYVAMRALSWANAFPAADLGIRKALGGMKPKEALSRAERWRPWRSYATLRLWEHGGLRG